MRSTPIATTPVLPATPAMPTSPGHAGIRQRCRRHGTPIPTGRRLPTSSPPSNPVWPHRPVRRRLGRRCPRAARPPSVVRATSRTTCGRLASRSAGRTPVRRPLPARHRPVGVHRANRLVRRTRRRVSSRPAVSRRVPIRRVPIRRGRRSPGRSRRVRPSRGRVRPSTGIRSTGTRSRGLSSSTDNRRRGSVRRGLRARTPRDLTPPSRVSGRRGSSPSPRNRGPAGVVRRISIRSTRTGVHRSTDPLVLDHAPPGRRYRFACSGGASLHWLTR